MGETKLTDLQRDVLQQFALRPSGAFVRGPEERTATLDLAEMGFVADPHAMNNALFTRITEAGREALRKTS